MTIKQALRAAIFKMGLARETGNKQLAAQCKEYIRANWKNRHNRLTVIGV